MANGADYLDMDLSAGMAVDLVIPTPFDSIAPSRSHPTPLLPVDSVLSLWNAEPWLHPVEG